MKKRNDNLVMSTKHKKGVVKCSSGFMKIVWARWDKNRKNHALTSATGNFVILSFSHVFKKVV